MASNSSFFVEKALGIFTNLTHRPEQFLSVNDDLASKLQRVTKDVYDGTKTVEETHATEALPELLLVGFDDEQVWQELELQNSAAISNLLMGVSQLNTATHLSFKAGLQEEDAESDQEDSLVDEEDVNETEARIEEDIEEDDADDLQLGGGFNFNAVCSDEESEEEKELKKLLDKAVAMDKEENEDDEDDDEDEGSLFGDNFDEQLDDKKSQSKSQSDVGQKRRKTVVDDAFFKMADLETFLDLEDAKEAKKRKKDESGPAGDDDDSSEEEEEVDVFADIPSDDEGISARKLRYKDFFDPPPDGVKAARNKLSADGTDGEESGSDVMEKDVEQMEEEHESSNDEGDAPVTKDLLGDDNDSAGDAGKKSTFELRQERLAKKIKTLESVNLGDKPWQLMGEVAAAVRPENSLLQEDLDFEQQTRLAPEITEESTKSLEDIIKQRIKDQAWDDVERKVKPVDTPFEYKKRIVLDQEKSKKSLGEIYEEEYLKQAEKEKEEQEDPQHEVIRKSMTSLFIQLDALANFHYTPKPAGPDVKVLTNLASITVEEVAPVSVSEAAMMAPEEIKEKSQRDLKGDSEKTKEDKKSERRAKKVEKRAKRRAREQRQKLVEKLKPGLGNKYAKERAMEDLEKQSKSAKSSVTVIKEGTGEKTGFTSSSKFFTKLQDQVTSRISDAKGTIKKKKKKAQANSAKLKL